MLFQELEQIRHAINHPKNEIIYNCENDSWDKVSLAWGMTSRALKFFEKNVNSF